MSQRHPGERALRIRRGIFNDCVFLNCQDPSATVGMTGSVVRDVDVWARMTRSSAWDDDVPGWALIANGSITCHSDRSLPSTLIRGGGIFKTT